MTRDRRFGADTPLNGWIRRHPELESKDGYVGTDMDLVWYNHRKAMMMIHEHKEYAGSVSPSQEATLSVVDQAVQRALTDPSLRLVSQRFYIPTHVHYCGLHTITCQHTSPDDGEVFIDGVKVTTEQLLRFLKFEWTPVIKVHICQQERIQSSRTTIQLENAATYIKETVYHLHPELLLLRGLYYKRKREILALESLFKSKDPEQERNLDDLSDLA